MLHLDCRAECVPGSGGLNPLPSPSRPSSRNAKLPRYLVCSWIRMNLSWTQARTPSRPNAWLNWAVRRASCCVPSCGGFVAAFSPINLTVQHLNFSTSQPSWKTPLQRVHAHAGALQELGTANGQPLRLSPSQEYVFPEGKQNKNASRLIK